VLQLLLLDQHLLDKQIQLEHNLHQNLQLHHFEHLQHHIGKWLLGRRQNTLIILLHLPLNNILLMLHNNTWQEPHHQQHQSNIILQHS
jgi:hypothetical protein